MKRIDLIGKRFGRLRVIAYAGRSRWCCVCDCNARVVVRGERLRSDRTKSCGCLRKIRATKHGMHGTPEYNSWRGMKDRCNNPRHPFYKYYGGRGITVCDEWLPFEGFFADTGTRPVACSLDRVNPDGNYDPGNVRWADRKLQTQNRRPRHASAAVKRQVEPPLPLDDPPF